MEKGQINIDFKKRRIAYNDTEMLVGQATRFTTISYESVVAYAAKAACVPESSIKLSIEALFDAMKYFVMNGHPVKIPYLGTFYLSVRVKSTATKEEFVANFAKNLRNISVCFRPAPELKARIASTTINTLVEEK
jgi:nucleoid DNA-binding protein